MAVDSLESVRMSILALKNAVNSRVIACHKRTPGIRKLPFPAVGIIIALVSANAIVWLAVGILLVWLTPTPFYLHLLANAIIALSCVQNPAGIQAGKDTELSLRRALVSTAVLSYTLGLRHALDADHISVCALNSSWQAHGNLIENPGNRSHDSPAHRIRSTSSHCRDFLLSWSFNVRHFYSSHVAQSLDVIDIRL